jgi:DNA-binding ferritin-like protein
MLKNTTKRRFSKRQKKYIKKSTKNNNRNKSVKIISNTKNQEKSHIVRIFLEMLNVIKLYHWKTRSFSQHKATDELYERLNGHIDKFIEVLLGKDESRIHMIEKNIELIDYSETTNFKERIYEYREFLTNIDRYLDNHKDSDLLNIRDEILADINQFLYLMTFDK